MRGTIVVAAREVVAQRAFVGASLVIAVLVLLAPWAPGFSQWEAEDVRGVAVLIMGFGFTLIASLLLGATVIGKELADGRFGFYLARPLGGTSIWLGKLLGAVLTVLCCELAVLCPLSLHVGLVERAEIENLSDATSAVNLAALVLVGLPAALILLTHVVGLIWRARSAWIALDIAALAAGGLAVWRAYRTVEPHVDWYYGDRLKLIIACAIVLAAVLLISGWVATVRGRADLRRVHGVLAVTMSGLVLAGAVGSLALARWMIGVDLDQLDWVKIVSAAPSRQWLALEGGAQRVLPIRRFFLYDHSSRRVVRLSGRLSPTSNSTVISFSNNGDRAVWLEPLDEDRYQVVVIDLRARPARITRTMLFLKGYPNIAISDHGRLLAASEPAGGSLYEVYLGIAGERTSVYELPSGRLLRSWQVPEHHISLNPVFVSDTTVRTYVAPAGPQSTDSPWVLRVFDLDVQDGRRMELNPVPEDQDWVDAVEIDRSHDRLLVRGARSEVPLRNLRVLDGLTDEPLFRLDRRTGPHAPRALSDGRIAAWRRAGRRIELVLLGRYGEIVEVIDLGPGEAALLGQEVAPGRVAVAIFAGVVPNRFKRLDTVEVDLATGRTREIGQWLAPLPPGEGLGRVYHTPEPGSILTRCFTGRGGELMIWDPETRELEQVPPVH